MMQPINRPGCHRRRRAGGRASLLPSKRLPVQHFIICVFEFRPNCVQVYGVAQKVNHYQIMKNRFKIVLKPVNKIRFIVKKIKALTKHYNIIRLY